MERKWVGRDVDLRLISECLLGFFTERGFETRKEELVKKYRIIGTPKYPHDVCDKITVVIEGNSNVFTINFVTGSRSHSLMRYGSLTTIFGGGSLWMRGVKSEEMLEKLEREFWVYVEETIERLSRLKARSSHADLVVFKNEFAYKDI